jgi:hypothetical protein
MFQNTGAMPFSGVEMVLDHAAGGRYWPSGMMVTRSRLRAWI